MITKDFLKQVLVDEKELLELHEIAWINAPSYAELGVKNLWPLMK